jgi:DNA polymerase III delta prime subunit
MIDMNSSVRGFSHPILSNDRVFSFDSPESHILQNLDLQSSVTSYAKSVNPIAQERKTFIAKYAPNYLSDFLCEPRHSDLYVSSPDDRANEPGDHGTEYVLKTLIDIDDMNVILVGGFNSGKTTMLYALAREYYCANGISYPLSETNVLFINNLKEQGIQFFRNDMKTFCQTHCSVPGKKKIIMIDDMDGINKQSQQVFRNYIDKYKQHVCVIASCSNLQKVVESLQSRLHILRIQPPTRSQIASMMDRIISREAISVDHGCREYLLERSNDNICNVINNLDKMSIYGRNGVILSRDVCEKLCSTISFHQFELYITALIRGNLTEAIRIIYSLYDYGYSVIDILEYFFEFVKTTHLIGEDVKYKVVPHICDSISIFHNTHENGIELAIFTNKIKDRLLS